MDDKQKLAREHGMKSFKRMFVSTPMQKYKNQN
jgi:hypothetical protein